MAEDKVILKLEEYQVKQIINSLVSSGNYVSAVAVIRQYLGYDLKEAYDYYKSLPAYINNK